MIQRRTFTLKTQILKLEVSEKDYVGHTVDQFLLSTEYALKKKSKASKINGLGSFGFLCLINKNKYIG